MHELRPPAETWPERDAASDVDDAPRPGTRAGWQGQLRHVLDHSVLPRITACGATRSSSEGPPPLVGADEIAALTDALLMGRPNAGLDQVAALRRRLVPLEQIYLELLAPAAQRLGEFWCRDTCDFFEVSVALHRLKRIFDTIRPRRGDFPAGGLSRRVLLAAAPGETHTFGISMVAEFFTMSGWDAALCRNEHCAKLLATQWFDVAGFSLGSSTCLAALKTVVAAARRVSRNPALGIIVGGPFFNERQSVVRALVRDVGADGTATDAKATVTLAKSLLTVQQPM